MLLRQVEFLPLTANRVLVILVINERDVQNRVIHTDREYSESGTGAGGELHQSRIRRCVAAEHPRALIESMQRDKANVDRMMQIDARHGDEGVRCCGTERADADGYVVTGETNLLNTPNDAEAMRRLFDAFSRKRDILHLLDRCLDSEGIQLFIGDESGYEVLGDYSVVTAPYRVNGGRRRRAGRDRADAHGLSEGDSDRRCDRAGAGRRARSHLTALATVDFLTGWNIRIDVPINGSRASWSFARMSEDKSPDTDVDRGPPE